MDQIIMMAMQTCQEYAEKSACHTLNEYEAQMYEHLSIFVKEWSKGHALVLRKQMPELERDALEAESEHRQWMKAQDDIEEGVVKAEDDADAGLHEAEEDEEDIE